MRRVTTVSRWTTAAARASRVSRGSCTPVLRCATSPTVWAAAQDAGVVDPRGRLVAHRVDLHEGHLVPAEGEVEVDPPLRGRQRAVSADGLGGVVQGLELAPAR